VRHLAVMHGSHLSAQIKGQSSTDQSSGL
jgi:hypothetical protein